MIFVSRKKLFFLCQLHFCYSNTILLLLTAGNASMFLIVFHPDTVILSFLCFMTVLQALTSRLSQDINYWREIEFVPLKILRSSSFTGLLSCFCDIVADSSWCGLLLASPVRHVYLGTHRWQKRNSCRHICRSEEEQWSIRREPGGWRALELPGVIHSWCLKLLALLLPCEQVKCTHKENSSI